MAIEFKTSLELDLVVAVWSGHITIDDFRVTFAGYLKDVHYKPGRTELIDFTPCTSVDADFPRIWSALSLVNSQVPGEKVNTRTVMIAPDDTIYGLARMYQSLADNAGGIRVELFRTSTDALAALALPYKTIADLLAAEVFLDHVQQSEERNMPRAK